MRIGSIITIILVLLVPYFDIEGAESTGVSAATFQAPELWDLGWYSDEIEVANLDTGIDLNYPNLSTLYQRRSNSWFDPNPEEQYVAVPDNSAGNGRVEQGPGIDPLAANPGDLDITFGTNGLTYTDIGTSTGDKAYSVLVQSDQKIVVVGSSNNGFDNDFAVARYDSFGILDADFSYDGKQTTAIGSGDDVANDVGIQSDGKIVVAGSAFNGTDDDFALARYTITGTLDTTFGVNGVITTTLSAGDDVAKGLAVQPDDKIVVVGTANEDFAVVRYSSEGDLDTGSFGGGDGIVLTDFFGALDAANDIAIQTDDGKLVVAGFSDIGASEGFAVARYLRDGSLDNTFAGTGKVTTDFSGNSIDQAYSVDIQTDGKIVLAGFINRGGVGASDDFALTRYNTNGSPDTTFGTDGKIVTPIGSNDDQAYSVAIQPTGKIVVAGFSDNGAPTQQDFSLARYTITGTLDTTLGATGVITTDLGTINTVNESADQAYAVAVQADNKIIVAGFTDHPAGNDNFAVVRYESPNTPPTVAKVNKTGLEDSEIAFTDTDFTSVFSDADGDILRKIQITSLPDFGTLSLNGTTVAQEQEILSSEAISLTFTPDQDFNGITGFMWNGSDGLDYASVDNWVEFSITQVNDAPSFTKGADPLVLEDAGAQSFANWAVDISPGAPFESSQTLTFTVMNNNEALFAVAPQIDETTGELTFTPAVEVNGSATITVTLADNGGTANGGKDTSAAQFFSISVTPVNDAPSFIKGSDETVLEDAGPQSVEGWASDISSGPVDESGQTSEFLLTTTDDAFFAALPEIDAVSGDLSYTPADDVDGAVTVTVFLNDNGGTINGGEDTSAPQNFRIDVLPVNDAPTISDIPDQQAFVNNQVGPLTFTIGDIDNAVEDLGVTGSSSNPSLVLSENIAFSGMGSDRTLVITPNKNQTGEATITVSVTDGELITKSAFKFTIVLSNLYMPMVLQGVP
jgi:uncharacterized delta-60 repeat protein